MGKTTIVTGGSAEIGLPVVKKSLWDNAATAPSSGITCQVKFNRRAR